MTIDSLGGAFNNYVDQILLNFDHLPHSSEWKIVDQVSDFLLTTYPPLFVHVHIERPLVEKQEKGGEKKKTVREI